VNAANNNDGQFHSSATRIYEFMLCAWLVLKRTLDMPLVSKGGIIAFHDIASDPEVVRFWNENIKEDLWIMGIGTYIVF